MNAESGLKIAVIGAGVAGITAAYLLQRRHIVTLFEKNDYVGGHTHTVVIDQGPDAGTPVDTGFIVFNDRTYPNFIRFLSQLGIAGHKTDMALSFECRRTGLYYAGTNLDGLFAQRRNLLRASFWRFLAEIVRFCRTTDKHLRQGTLRNLTLGEYAQRERFGTDVLEQFVFPMASAIWSTPNTEMKDFPAESLARFYDNHGLLSLRNRPTWYFIPGGSHQYVKAFLRGFRGKVLANCGVAAVRRTESGVALKLADGAEETFDRVVIAAHADEARALLADASPEEARLLSVWEYAANHTVLHCDTSLLPPAASAWGAWNYLRGAGVETDSRLTVTYYMNRLQCLEAQRHYCVTLNPAPAIPRERVIEAMNYTHPMYSIEAMATQDQLRRLNGQRNTFFCGSYLGYGFHEDGVRSAVDVARSFGISL